MLRCVWLCACVPLLCAFVWSDVFTYTPPSPAHANILLLSLSPTPLQEMRKQLASANVKGKK